MRFAIEYNSTPKLLCLYFLSFLIACIYINIYIYSTPITNNSQLLFGLQVNFWYCVDKIELKL